MSSIVSAVTSYLPFRKGQPAAPEPSAPDPDTPEDDSASKEENQKITDPEDVKENDTPELPSDKKTDEQYDPALQPGFVRRLTSGVYNTTTSAVGMGVGMGVGSVKWVAGKGYDATTVVVGTTKNVISKVPLPTLKRKDKKE